jgi:hypothetical protein
MLFVFTSPSSPPADTENVTVTDDEPAVTTAVGADAADADPPPFDAVTLTRMVDPTSTDVSMYVCAVAGRMSTQFPPEESQRRHS